MLIFILQSGHTEVVELLLKTPGIDVNAASKWGETPLFLAAQVSYNHIEHIYYICIQHIICFMFMFILQRGHTEVVELLLKTPGIDVNAADKRGETPLYRATYVSYNHIEHI